MLKLIITGNSLKDIRDQVVEAGGQFLNFSINSPGGSVGLTGVAGAPVTQKQPTFTLPKEPVKDQPLAPQAVEIPKQVNAEIDQIISTNAIHEQILPQKKRGRPAKQPSDQATPPEPTENQSDQVIEKIEAPVSAQSLNEPTICPKTGKKMWQPPADVLNAVRGVFSLYQSKYPNDHFERSKKVLEHFGEEATRYIDPSKYPALIAHCKGILSAEEKV